MKRFYSLVLSLCLLVCLAPARAVVLIQSGTSNTPVSFLAVLSSDGQTAITGLTGAAAGTKVACNGSGVAGSVTVGVQFTSASGSVGAYANAAGSVAEDGYGNYDYFPASSEVAATGILKIHVTAATMQTQEYIAQVVGFNPNSSSNLGLTSLPNALPGAAGGLPKLDAFGNNSVNVVSYTTQPAGGGTQSIHGDGTVTNWLSSSFSLPNAAVGTSTFAAGQNVTLANGAIDLPTFTANAKYILAPRGYLQVTGNTTPATAGNYYEDTLVNNVPTYSNSALATPMTFWYNGSTWTLSATSAVGTTPTTYFGGATAVNGTYTASGVAPPTVTTALTITYKANGVMSVFQPEYAPLLASAYTAAPTAAQIVAAFLAAPVDGPITVQQSLGVGFAVSNDTSRTWNAATHTAVTTYYRVLSGSSVGAADHSRPVKMLTTVYDATNTNVVMQTVSFVLTNLNFPN